jgi:FkbM family methyltransferase
MKHVVEVGCNGRSSIHELVSGADRAQIIEAHPEHYRNTKEFYKEYSGISVYHAAVWHSVGKIWLYPCGLSSFVQGIASPRMANGGNRISDPIEVPSITFDMLDDGSIDFVELDSEGAEWWALKHMRSRPATIQIEMRWKRYKNPHFAAIQNWMADNCYVLARIAGADFVYIQAP